MDCQRQSSQPLAVCGRLGSRYRCQAADAHDTQTGDLSTAHTVSVFTAAGSGSAGTASAEQTHTARSASWKICWRCKDFRRQVTEHRQAIRLADTENGK
jgi:hypothetical protein